MKKTAFIFLTFILSFSNYSYSCSYWDQQFISMEDIGNGEFLFTFNLCQGASDGEASYTTGFLLEIPCLTITDVLTTSLVSTNGVEITSLFSGSTIEWGDINDQTLPHFIDGNVNGGSQQCFTIQFEATLNADCQDISLIPYDFVAAWGPFSGSVWPGNGQDHCWGSGVIVIPCEEEQIDVTLNGFWGLVGWGDFDTYLEIMNEEGDTVYHFDYSELVVFNGSIPICFTCGSYEFHFVQDPEDFNFNEVSLTATYQSNTITSEIGADITVSLDTDILCCSMTVVDGGEPINCPGECDGVITLTDYDAEGDVLYSIDGGVTTQDSGIFSNLCPGSYEVMVADTGGCVHTNTIVLISNYPEVIIDNNDVITNCGEETVTFINNSLNATSYLWDFGNGATSTEQNPTYTFVGPNSYEVILTAYNDQNCSVLSTDTFNIDINGELVHADFEVNSPNCNLTHIDINNLSTGSISSYLWDMGDGIFLTEDSISYDYIADGEYDITLSISNELCADYASYTLPVSVFYTVAGDIKIPNVFTPNSDQDNKVFEIYFDNQELILPEGTVLTDHLDVYSMEVFNRWGNVVFDSNESDDVSWSAEEAADGVYYYIIKYQRTCSDKEVQTTSGHVTILR